MTVDLLQAERFLATRYGSPVRTLSRLGHGEWSTAYAYNHDGHDFVIRFGQHPDDFARDQFAAQFASVTLPVPTIYEIGAAFGQHYAISNRLDGRYLDDLDEAQMRAVLPSLMTALDAMRSIDLSATTGFGNVEGDGNAPFATWADYLLDCAIERPGRVSNWRQPLVDSPSGSSAFDEAFGLLREQVGEIPEVRALVHSDLLNFNVLASPDDGRISGVLDWGCAFYGDFLYDLAWFVFWQYEYRAWAAIDFVDEAHRHYAAIGLDVPQFAQRLQCCLLHIGLGDQIYNAFKGRQDRLARGSNRLREIIIGIT